MPTWQWVPIGLHETFQAMKKYSKSQFCIKILDEYMSRQDDYIKLSSNMTKQDEIKKGWVQQMDSLCDNERIGFEQVQFADKNAEAAVICP